MTVVYGDRGACDECAEILIDCKKCGMLTGTCPLCEIHICCDCGDCHERNTMEEEHRYRITYQVDQHPDGITKKELDERSEDLGACDALFLCSVIGKFGEGPLSTMWMGIDGNNENHMTPFNMFQLWSILAANLVDELPQGGPHQAIAQDAIDSVRALLVATKAMGDN